MAEKSPWGCFVPGILIVGLFGLVGYAVSDEEAQKAKARASAPPPVVAVEDFDPAKDRHSFDEVNVRAQLDIKTMDKVIDEDSPSDDERRTTVVRLYPASAKDRNAPAPGVLVTYKPLSANRIIAMTEKMGPIGPIVVINGRAQSTSGIKNDAAKAIDRGPLVAEDAPYIEPFMDDRMAALAAEDGGATVFFSGLVVSLPFFIWGLVRLRKKRLRDIDRSQWERI